MGKEMSKYSLCPAWIHHSEEATVGKQCKIFVFIPERRRDDPIHTAGMGMDMGERGGC